MITISKGNKPLESILYLLGPGSENSPVGLLSLNDDAIVEIRRTERIERLQIRRSLEFVEFKQTDELTLCFCEVLQLDISIKSDERVHASEVVARLECQQDSSVLSFKLRLERDFDEPHVLALGVRDRTEAFDAWQFWRVRLERM